MDLSALMDLACEAARRAGQLARERAVSRIEVKGRGKGLVTEIDHLAEQTIVSCLRENSLFPVLAEEGGEQGGSGDVRWVVDPIDGTTNLARGVPLFCISIALLDRHNGLVGVVYDPLRDELFHGAKGQGAFLGNQPISVSSTLDPATTTLCISHGYDIEDRQRCGELARRLITTNYLLQLGSTALELCYVACGRVDAYIGSGEELWDYAAALTLVPEAGGQITNWHGAPWDGSHSYLLAGGETARRQLAQTIGDLQILP